jgi:hypothetical protein
LGEIGAAGALGFEADTSGLFSSIAPAISASVAPHFTHSVASGLLTLPQIGHLIGVLKFTSAGLKHM